VIQNSRGENDLSTMMGFVGSDIGHEVDDVRRDIAPGNINFQIAADVETCVQQSDHSFAALPQCTHQFCPCHPPTIDASWSSDSISSPDHFDPHTSCVVDMACDHADGASGVTGQFHTPQFIWKVFKERLCHVVTRIPAFDQSIAKSLFGIQFSCHWLLAFVNKKRIEIGSGHRARPRAVGVTTGVQRFNDIDEFQEA
jgi:hypothetical protein